MYIYCAHSTRLRKPAKLLLRIHSAVGARNKIPREKIPIHRVRARARAHNRARGYVRSFSLLTTITESFVRVISARPSESMMKIPEKREEYRAWYFHGKGGKEGGGTNVVFARGDTRTPVRINLSENLKRDCAAPTKRGNICRRVLRHCGEKTYRVCVCVFELERETRANEGGRRRISN